MDEIRDQFHQGRRKMIDTFVKLSDLARRSGAVDEDQIIELHGEFFDGNVEVKDAYEVTAFKAELHRAE